jgi:oligoribonuclease (3'-5' exoribonuclease)
MSQQYYLLWDTETGDLEPDTGDLLTAYFAIVDEDLRVVDELDLKLKPNDGRLPIANAGALKVNGIDLRAHLADPETVTYAEGKTKLVTLIKKYLKKTGRYSNIRPAGYNCPFDVKFTQAYLLPAEEWNSMLHYKQIDVMQYVDFLKLCGIFPPSLGSLNTVIEHLQLPKRQFHTAKDDSLATLDVLKNILGMMKKLKESSSGGIQGDLISLLEAE